MTLFPIKPVGCCDNGKCYVSLDEFKALKTKVNAIDDDVEDLMDKSMVSVDFTLVGGVVSIADIVDGIYTIRSNGSTYVLMVKSDVATCYSTVGAYSLNGVIKTTVVIGYVTDNITLRHYLTDGTSVGFDDDTEIYITPL